MFRNIIIVLVVFVWFSGCVDDSVQQPAQIPGAPHELRAVALDSAVIHLTWVDDVYMEEGYYLYESRGLGFTFELVDTLMPNTTSMILNGRDPNTPYQYKIRSFNVNGESAYSNTARVFDLELITTLLSPGLRTKVNAMDVSPDSRLLAIGRVSISGSTSLECWDLTSYTLAYTDTVLRNIYDLAFSGGGEFLATSEYNPPTVRLLRSDTGEELFSTHSGAYLDADEAVDKIAFHPSDNLFVASTHQFPTLGIPNYFRLKEWRRESNGDVTFLGVREYVTENVDSMTVVKALDLEFSPNGAYLAGALTPDSIVVWDGLDLRVIRIIDIETAVYSVSFSADSKLLAATYADGKTRFWDVEDGSLQAEIDDDGQKVFSADFSPDGLYFAAANLNDRSSEWGYPEIWTTHFWIPVTKVEDQIDYSHGTIPAYLEYTHNGDNLIIVKSSLTEVWRFYR